MELLAGARTVSKKKAFFTQITDDSTGSGLFHKTENIQHFVSGKPTAA